MVIRNYNVLYGSWYENLINIILLEQGMKEYEVLSRASVVMLEDEWHTGNKLFLRFLI